MGIDFLYLTKNNSIIKNSTVSNYIISKNFLLFKVSPKVTKGSTIRVTSKNKKSKRKNQNKVDWNQQIENAMLKISAVLTLWVLVDRVQTQ